MNNKYRNILTVPNFITFLRILLVPIFLIFFYRGLTNNFSVISIYAGLLIFILIRGTDVLDGWIARLTNSTTVLGSYLDIWADFFFVLSSFIMLNSLKIIPLWVTLIITYKFFEFLVLSELIKRHFKDNNNCSTNIYYDVPGRIVSSFFYLFPAVALVFRFFDIDYFLLNIICYVLLLFTIVSSILKYFTVKNIFNSKI